MLEAIKTLAPREIVTTGFKRGLRRYKQVGVPKLTGGSRTSVLRVAVPKLLQGGIKPGRIYKTPQRVICPVRPIGE